MVIVKEYVASAGLPSDMQKLMIFAMALPPSYGS